MLNWLPVNFIKGAILYAEIIGLSDYVFSKEIVLNEQNICCNKRRIKW